jgi:DNA-binding NarL/FixJ family response regulator
VANSSKNKIDPLKEPVRNGSRTEAGASSQVGELNLQTQHLNPSIANPNLKTKTAWALIDPEPLIREALVRMMEEADAPAVIGAASIEDLLLHATGPDLHMRLVMLHLADRPANHDHVCRCVETLHEEWAAIPIVVLSNRIQVDEISAALRAGARGYIPTSWSSAEVMSALKHVEAGGIHVPPEALSHLLETSRHNGRRGDGAKRGHRQFTPRQLEVLNLVRQGKPNKIIAYELDMQESTVKVHVRDIMKKLNVSNRTEAAIRAGELLDERGNALTPSTSTSTAEPASGPAR